MTNLENKEPILDPNINSSNFLKIVIIFFGYTIVGCGLGILLLPYGYISLVVLFATAGLFPVIPVKLMDKWCEPMA